MIDPVSLLSEYVRIDTSNPPGDCRGTAELLCRALRENGLSPLVFGAKPDNKGSRARRNVKLHEVDAPLREGHVDPQPRRPERRGPATRRLGCPSR